MVSKTDKPPFGVQYSPNIIRLVWLQNNTLEYFLFLLIDDLEHTQAKRIHP